jgi:hypothetical protein
VATKHQKKQQRETARFFNFSRGGRGVFQRLPRFGVFAEGTTEHNIFPGYTMATATQAEDRIYGRGNEWNNKGVIEKHLSTSLSPLGYYDTFDFTNTNNTIYVELKSRRCASTLFPTSIIGENKVVACNDPSKTYWFCFAYTDGLFIIKYNKDVFDNFPKVNEFKRSDRTDANNAPQRVILIPNTHLTKITTA